MFNTRAEPAWGREAEVPLPRNSIGGKLKGKEEEEEERGERRKKKREEEEGAPGAVFRHCLIPRGSI